MITNSHITIYNKYTDPTTRTEKYKRSEVYNVVWQAVRGIGRMKEQIAANTTLILIPFASGNGFVDAREWRADTLHTGWTLQEGDLVARGMTGRDITTEYSVTQLRANYEVVAIASTAAMDQGTPNVQHWELNCK